jgi:hypothetical protein
MPEAPFDAWTRRRFGLATGGGIAALLGLAATEIAGAKKNGKKRKKRCRKLGTFCKPGSKRTCCGKLKCNRESSVNPAKTVCCKAEGKSCSPLPTEPECCGELSCCGLPGNEICSPICFSDRALKTNFATVDPGDMLQRVRELPIATWNYTSDDPAIRHIGPMAQDFAALFGVGADDRHIHPLDGQGVALAAIQGLGAEVARLHYANVALAERLARLESGGPQ